MAFILKDRVKESTTTTGTGNISLGGALATFDTFQTYLSNGDTTFYAIAHTSSGVDEWEVGLGTWNTGNTLTRTTVLAGSNSTSAVTFSAGTKDVFMTYPASKAIVSGEDAAFANITVTGTVDGRDIAADGTKLDGVEASADVTDTANVTSAGALMRSGGTMTGNLVLNANPSAALGAATKQYVDTEVSSLVDSAPSTLDTLNELAAALGDDANFSTTVTNSIATKLPLSGGTMSGQLVIADNDGGQSMLQVRNFATSATGGFTNAYTAEIRGATSGGQTHGMLINLNEANDSRRTLDIGDNNGVFASFVNGKLGLGTQSPAGTLHLHSADTALRLTSSQGSNTPLAQLQYSSSGGYFLRMGDSANNEDVMIRTYGNSHFNGGNVLVGKTSSSATTQGIQLNADGRLWATATENDHIFNRRTSDGGVISVRKDGVEVGSISVGGGNAEYRSASALSLRPNSGTSATGNIIWGQGNFKPWNSSYFDLGDSTYKWKDLHLSGAVNAATGTYSGDVQAAGLYVGATNTSYDFYNNGTSYLNGATTIDANTTINGNLNIETTGGGSLTLKDTNGAGAAAAVYIEFDDSNGNRVGYVGIGSGSSNDNWLYSTSGKPILGSGNNSAPQYYNGTSYNNIFHDGYHPNADAWTTARTLSLSGDASGSVSWDGSANATLSVSVGDADTVDGVHASGFVRGDGTNHSAITIRADNTDFIVQDQGDSITNFIWRDHSANTLYLGTGNAVITARSTINANSNNITNVNQLNGGTPWTSANDGSGSGLDADVLDGVQGSSYLRSDADDTYAGNLTVNGVTFKNNSNLTHNLKIQPTGSSTTVGLSMYTPSGSHAIQLYGGSTTYGFLDANWGSWDIQKTKNGAFKVDEGGGLQRVFNDGYHPNADAWTTSRTLSLTGDATGSVSIDGSANATLSVSVGDADTVDGVHGSSFGRTDSGVPDFQYGIQSGDIHVGTDGDTDGDYQVTIRTVNSSDILYLQAGVSGHVDINNSARSPIFYDRDDTSYYVNPASTGSSVRIKGNIDTRTQNSTTQNNQLYFGLNNGNSDGTSNNIGSGITWAPLYSGYSKRSAGILSIGEGNYFRSGLAFYTNNTADGSTDWSERMRLDMDGNLINYVSVRSPIYYDSDDTAYYTNPANNSVMNQISLGIPGNGSNTKGRFIALEGNADSSGEASGRIFFTEHNNTTAAMDAYGMSLGYRGGATSITGTSGNAWTGLTQISNGQWGMWGHDANATGALIMYGDRAATFVNFAGNDIQNVGTLLPSCISVDGGTGNCSTDGTVYVTATNNNDWGLIVDKYNGNSSEYGVDIRMGSSFSYGLRVLGAGSTVSGISSAQLYHNSSVRGPIFYDSANTSYYVDPASTSRLNAIDFGDSSPTLSQDGDYLKIQTTTGYISIGSANAGYAHFYTDRSQFYFNNTVTVDGGGIRMYDSGADVRAFAFYDQVNTGFYVDPSSTNDSIRVAGNIVAYYSDERLKDIEGNIDSPLEKVCQLNGFYYTANKKAQTLGYKDNRQVGVSAQEVEAVMPEVVTDAAIGHGYKTVDYAKIVPLLIEAVKEQQDQIETLKSRLEKLEN